MKDRQIAATKNRHLVTKEYSFLGIFELEEALARRVAARKVADDAAALYEDKCTIELAESSKNLATILAAAGSACIRREEARTRSVEEAEAAGTPTLPRAKPPTRPFGVPKASLSPSPAIRPAAPAVLPAVLAVLPAAYPPVPSLDKIEEVADL